MVFVTVDIECLGYVGGGTATGISTGKSRILGTERLTSVKLKEIDLLQDVKTEWKVKFLCLTMYRGLKTYGGLEV
jgi:hypothetical protein